jgi:hypothetical protein
LSYGRKKGNLRIPQVGANHPKFTRWRGMARAKNVSNCPDQSV